MLGGGRRGWEGGVQIQIRKQIHENKQTRMVKHILITTKSTGSRCSNSNCSSSSSSSSSNVVVVVAAAVVVVVIVVVVVVVVV